MHKLIRANLEKTLVFQVGEENAQECSMWDFQCGVYTAAHAEKVSVMLNYKTYTLFLSVWVNSKQELQIHFVAL